MNKKDKVSMSMNQEGNSKTIPKSKNLKKISFQNPNQSLDKIEPMTKVTKGSPSNR